mgnify:CR=1 FL=1
MVMTYPAAIPGWSTKRDFQEPIWAQHFNRVQDEITATERTLGLMPHVATADPGGLTPDYGTVSARIQAIARGEPMITYRGYHLNAQIIPNEYFRPRLEAAEDTHGMAHGTGFMIAETGYWMITAKADWLPTSVAQQQITTRMLILEINGRDVGLRDVLLETDKNRENMTTMITWQENLEKGTHITVALHAILADTTRTIAPVNVYLRAHLVRCLEKGGPGLPIPWFEPDPRPDPPSRPRPPDDGCQPPPDDGCQNYVHIEPQPRPPSGGWGTNAPIGTPPYAVFYGASGTQSTYDSSGTIFTGTGYTAQDAWRGYNWDG